MEKWKLGVIIALVFGICAYGYFQQNPLPTAPLPNEPPPPPPPTGKFFKLKGKVPPAWNIPQKLWFNVPAPVTPQMTKGKVTVIEFWRIGCHHCEESVPFLNNLFVKYKPLGVEFVAIHTPGDLTSADNPELDWEGVKTTMKKWGIKYPVAYDEKGKLYKEAYSGETYPALLVVGRDGKIAHLQTGHTPEKEREFVAALEAAVKKK